MIDIFIAFSSTLLLLALISIFYHCVYLLYDKYIEENKLDLVVSTVLKVIKLFFKNNQVFR